MDSIPRITVRTHYDETHNQYKLVLTKSSQEEFKLEIGTAVHVYLINDLFDVLNIITTDHLRYRMENAMLLIESNLCHTKDTRGKHVYKDLQPMLQLFSCIKSLRMPVNITADYA